MDRIFEFKLVAIVIVLIPFIAVISYSIPEASGAEPISQYHYVRLDVKISEGVVTENNLLMLPADDEYRLEKFESIRIAGKSESVPGKDIESAAKHNAITNLLTAYGLKSIKCTRETRNLVVHDEIIMSYEGVIKPPFKILRQGYANDNRSVYNMDLEISFCPLASPDKWSFLHFKNRLHQLYRNLLSVF